VFEIVKEREVAPNVHEIVIHAPAVAKKARPGQFVILMVDEKSERVPYTLCNWDREAGTITLIVQEVGQSSRKLVLLHAGDHVAHLVGPLGLPLEIERFGTVALAAGCYGIGAILGIARAMKAAGNRVVAIVEADSHYLHYFRAELEATTDEFIQTTIDGSESIKGHSIDVVKQKLESGEQLDLVIAVGCLFMMMLAGNVTKPFGVKTLVALNPIMLDGTGMCGDRRVAYSDDEIQAVARTAVVEHRQQRAHACVA
jgi:NAD(P)H-flavin reductase